MEMTLKTLYVVLTILLLSLSGAYAYEGDIVQVGNPAPAFNALSIDGTGVSVPDTNGRVVLLVFFATWCDACSVEMQYIEQEIRHKFNVDGFVVIAVGRGHSNEDLAVYKASGSASFQVVADPERDIYNQYATKKIPRCYVIGKDGVVKYGSIGFNKENNAIMEELIASELNQ
jgi:peroxiredoxin